MSEVKVLLEVIGGPKVVASVDPSAPMEGTAAVLAAAVDRSLLGDDGEPLAWKLFAPGRGGGFSPLAGGTDLGGARDWAQELVNAGKDGGFAGPGEHEGQRYSFRVRLFLPKPPPPKAVDETPPDIEDEDALDLTDMDQGISSLESLRRRPDAKKKRRRKKAPGEAATGETAALTPAQVAGSHGVSATPPAPSPPPPPVPSSAAAAPSSPSLRAVGPPGALAAPPTVTAPPSKSAAPNPPPAAAPPQPSLVATAIPTPTPRPASPAPAAPPATPSGSAPATPAPAPPPSPIAPPSRESTERIAMPRLAAATPAPGQVPVTTPSETRVVTRLDEKSKTTTPPKDQKTTTPPKDQKTTTPPKDPPTGPGLSGAPRKKPSNTPLFAAIAILALVGLFFAFALLRKDGGGTAPTPTPAAPAAPTRHSQDLRLADADLGEGTPGDAVARAVQAYESLGLATPRDAGPAATRQKLTRLDEILAAECRGGHRFDACHVWARVTYAGFAGCMAASCGSAESGEWFKKSAEATNVALDRAVALPEAASKSVATRLLAAQALRLGSANQKTVAALAPRVAALGERSCKGGAASSADCVALMKTR